MAELNQVCKTVGRIIRARFEALYASSTKENQKSNSFVPSLWVNRKSKRPLKKRPGTPKVL
jgi:hypothetical protein